MTSSWHLDLLMSWKSRKAKVDASWKEMWRKLVFHSNRLKFLLRIYFYYRCVLCRFLEISTIVFTGYPGISCLLYYGGKFEIIYAVLQAIPLLFLCSWFFFTCIYRFQYIWIRLIVLVRMVQYFFVILAFNRDQSLHYLLKNWLLWCLLIHNRFYDQEQWSEMKCPCWYARFTM